MDSGNGQFAAVSLLPILFALVLVLLE